MKCTKCGETDPLKFHKNPRAQCMACTRSDNNARSHKLDPEKREAHRLRARKHALMKNYGLTYEAFHEMFEKQNGECAICTHPVHPTHEDRYQTGCVDHCHETGKVRGVLCWDCNVGLGKFHDDISKMRKAILYLEESQC